MVASVGGLTARRAQNRFYQHFPSVLRKFVLLCGEQGRGKTVSGIYLAKTIQRWMERYEDYSPRVVVVATEIGITEEFGEHYSLSVPDFLCQLRGINLVAELLTGKETDDEIERLMMTHTGCSNEAHQDGKIQWGNKWITLERAESLSDKQRVLLGEKGEACWTSRNGIVLYKSIVLCDEAHELLSSQMASNPVVRAMTNFIAKMRHFKITLLGMSPNPLDIARRARDQVFWEVWCNTRKQRGPDGRELATGTSATFKRPGVNREGRGVFSVKFDPNDYFKMYDSHQILTFNGRSLNIDAKFF